MEKDTIKIGVPFKGMIGHRGCAGLETENTLKAFNKGGSKTYIGLECDVHPTLDGFIVVNHDETLERVVGNKAVINKMTFNDLRAIPFPDKANDSIINDEIRIPLLEEYLDVCIKYDKIPVIELKQTLRSQDIDRVLEIVDSKNLMDKVIFISFFPGYLTKIRQQLPNVKIQFLSQTWSEGIFDLCVHFNFGIDLEHTKCTKEVIDKMHSKGLKVNVYTVDDKDEALTLISYGIDYITSNILE